MVFEDVRCSFDHGPRLVHDPVVDPLEPVVVPAVDRAHPGLAAEVERVDMADEAEPDLAWDVVGRQARPPLVELIGLDVVVVQPVDDEDRCLDVAEVVVVVRARPRTH